jgi:hypothetical protein
MDPTDDQFLREKAAECRERAGRARDDKDRALWLELAEAIAGRLPQALAQRRPHQRDGRGSERADTGNEKREPDREHQLCANPRLEFAGIVRRRFVRVLVHRRAVRCSRTQTSLHSSQR